MTTRTSTRRTPNPRTCPAAFHLERVHAYASDDEKRGAPSMRPFPLAREVRAVRRVATALDERARPGGGSASSTAGANVPKSALRAAGGLEVKDVLCGVLPLMTRPTAAARVVPDAFGIPLCASPRRHSPIDARPSRSCIWPPLGLRTSQGSSPLMRAAVDCVSATLAAATAPVTRTTAAQLRGLG